MNSQAVITVLSIVALATMVSSAPSNTDLNKVISEAKQSGMELIGQIGDKVYFVNRTESNWMGGESRCNSANLQFATLRNRDEFAFVRQKIDNSENLWIGASMRGINIYENFKAFEYLDGSDVPNDINTMPQDFGINLCLYLSGSDHTYMDSCSRAQYGILCEIPLA